MSGAFRENWKRLSNKFAPNDMPSALEPKDIIRVEDLNTTFAASGVVTVSGVTPSNGDLLVGIDGGWTVLPSGAEGLALKVEGGALAWGVVASSGSGSGGSGGAVTTVVPATGTSVTLTNSDFFLGASGSISVVSLPPNPADGQRHVIKDSIGNASSVNVTINGNGHLIDDSITVLLINNYQATSVLYSAVLGRWQLI